MSGGVKATTVEWPWWPALPRGTLLRAVGFTDMEYYTTLLGWSRIAGIRAQIVDERLHFRNGRGVAIYRPKCVALHQARRAVT